MALKFYQSISNNISTLSFDLDDTLYQNKDVIKKAEQAQFDAVCRIVPEAQEQGIAKWQKLKWSVAKQKPEVRHDVSEWRLEVIKAGLADFGVTEEKLIQQVYDSFFQARSDFTMPQQTFDVLTQLKKKYQLIAVTNGNVDIDRVGLSGYFEGYYRAGANGCRMKPYPDMLTMAMKDLTLKPEQIIHIGDSVGSDIKAAHNAGVSSLWFNPDNKSYPSGYALPTAEYSELHDLLEFIS